VTERMEWLLNEILKLPPTEVAELLARVETALGVAEPALDAELMNEVRRRVDRPLAGDRSGSTAREVEARIRAKVTERRAGR
jgi:hypothetical protein